MRIVIDTSVAKAAGRGRPDAGPPSPACVAAFEAIDAAGLSVAHSTELKQEWLVHARPFARKWLASMFARKRVQIVREPWPREADLLSAAADLPGDTEKEVTKDAHLVSLAMQTDRRVVSLDARQRALLKRLVPAIPELGPLHWTDPSDARVVPWLREGAADAPSLQLRA